MNSIPTRYGGVNFRSRLEAKWAAFFDLLGWPWQYEPIDLAGYIPDFLLKFHRPLLVEVKPVIVQEEISAHAGKLESSGWPGDFMIVGATFFERPSFDGFYPPVVGLHWGEQVALDWGEGGALRGLHVRRGWRPAGLFYCKAHGGAAVVRQAAVYRCEVCGASTVDAGILVGSFNSDELWRIAGNKVQWQPPRG